MPTNGITEVLFLSVLVIFNIVNVCACACVFLTHDKGYRFECLKLVLLMKDDQFSY